MDGAFQSDTETLSSEASGTMDSWHGTRHSTFMIAYIASVTLLASWWATQAWSYRRFFEALRRQDGQLAEQDVIDDIAAYLGVQGHPGLAPGS